MEKILRYKKAKNNMYLVTFDKEELLLYDDIVIQYELLLRKAISESELEEIKRANKERDSYYDALQYITKKMRSEKEVITYLQKKGYSSQSILKTVKILKKENAINDKMFAHYYIHDAIRLSLIGPLKIKNNLLDLGIIEEDINKELDDIDENVWQEKIEKIVLKKDKSNHKDSVKIWSQKMLAYLRNMGYPYELCDFIVSSYERVDSDDILRKEANKLKTKLSRKYDGSALVKQLKMKLYQKGFQMEDILRILNEYE